MDIKFHPTVVKAKKKNLGKQVVQTVTQVSMLDDKLDKAKHFLETRGIKHVRGVYGAPA